MGSTIGKRKGKYKGKCKGKQEGKYKAKYKVNLNRRVVPNGPPVQYGPGPAAVNFGLRKRSGVLAAIWPLATMICLHNTKAISHGYRIFPCNPWCKT